MRLHLLKRGSFLLSVFLNILIFSSCKKEKYETPAQVNLYEMIRQDKVAFTYLKAAIDRTAMQGIFENEKITFVAPTNAAFINAGYKTIKMIEEADPVQLTNLLKYHILPAGTDLTAVTDSATLTMGNEQSVLVVKPNEKLTSLNGSNVTAFNYKGTNGMLSVVDKLLLPAMGNIMQVLEADANLIFFRAALVRASTGNTNLVQLLTGNTAYTVFALSNAAFSSTPYSTLALINAADPNTLATFLSYYITSGKKFSSQFTDRSQSVQLNQNKAYFDLTSTNSTINGISVPLSNTLRLPLINGRMFALSSNQQAINGVVHVLDGVINSPTGNLNKTVSDLGLTYLAAAIAKASTGTTNVADILSGTTEYTLIAPSNAAFTAAGYASLAAVSAANANDLAAMLKLHIVKAPRYIAGIYISSNANTLYDYSTLAEKNITFQFVSPSYTVKGTGNTTAAILSPNNYTCTNGVLHISNIILNQ